MLLRLENICLALYSEEEVLHSKGKLSVLCFISWMSGMVLGRPQRLAVFLKMHNWKKSEKRRGKFASFLFGGFWMFVVGFGVGFF